MRTVPIGVSTDNSLCHLPFLSFNVCAVPHLFNEMTVPILLGGPVRPEGTALRIRIIRHPPLESIDGIQLSRFEQGRQYEVGNVLGAFLLSVRWAEPVADEQPALLIPFNETEPASPKSEPVPPNLIREKRPTPIEVLGVTADFERRTSRRH